jgi:hypothetical protein
MTGDEGTGRIEAIPTTKYPKGIATKLAVDSNQYSLFSLLPDYVEEEELEPRLTWILLRRREGTLFSLNCLYLRLCLRRAMLRVGILG